MKDIAKQHDKPNYNQDFRDLSPEEIGERITNSYNLGLLTDEAFWDSLTLPVRYKVLIFYRNNEADLDINHLLCYHYLLTPEFIQYMEYPLLTSITTDLLGPLTRLPEKSDPYGDAMHRFFLTWEVRVSTPSHAKESLARWVDFAGLIFDKARLPEFITRVLFPQFEGLAGIDLHTWWEQWNDMASILNRLMTPEGDLGPLPLDAKQAILHILKGLYPLMWFELPEDLGIRRKINCFCGDLESIEYSKEMIIPHGGSDIPRVTIWGAYDVSSDGMSSERKVMLKIRIVNVAPDQDLDICRLNAFFMWNHLEYQVEILMLFAYGEYVAQLSPVTLQASFDLFKKLSISIKTRVAGAREDLFFYALWQVDPPSATRFVERLVSKLKEISPAPWFQERFVLTREPWPARLNGALKALPPLVVAYIFMPTSNNYYQDDIYTGHWWLRKGGDYHEARQLPEAAEAYQRGIISSIHHSEDGEHALDALWANLGGIFSELELHGEALHCWSNILKAPNQYIQKYLEEVRGRCALTRMPPLLDPTTEYLPGLWHQWLKLNTNILPTNITENEPSLGNLVPEKSKEQREQRLLSLFSPHASQKDRTRILGEILALALPREKESLDTISVLEYAIAAQGESEILKYHHVPWEGIRITPQLVKNNPICPQLQELYEDTGVLPDEWTLRLKADEAWWDCPRDEDDYTDAEIEAYERYGPPRIEYELDVPQFLDVHREDNWEFFA